MEFVANQFNDFILTISILTRRKFSINQTQRRKLIFQQILSSFFACEKFHCWTLKICIN